MKADKKGELANLLRVLEGLVRNREDLEASVTEVIISAKRAGASWQTIAEVLGVTRQSAHSKYKKAVLEADE